MSIEFLATSLIVIVTPGTGVLYTLAAGLSRGARASVVAAFGCTLGIVPHMAAAIAGVAALLHTSALAFETLKWLGVAYLLYMAWSAWRERGALRIEAAPPPLIPAQAGSEATPQPLIPAPGSAQSAARVQAPAEIRERLAKDWVPAPRFAKAKLWLRGGESAGTSGEIANPNTGTSGRAARLRQNFRADLKVTVEAILINILNPKLSIFFFAFLPQFVSGDEPHPLARMALLSAVFMGLTFVVFVGYGLFAARVRAHVIARPRVLTWMRRTFAAAFVALSARLAMAER